MPWRHVEYQVDMFFAIGANASARVELCLGDMLNIKLTYSFL